MAVDQVKKINSERSINGSWSVLNEFGF
jgi:hypothetical protein